MNSPIPRITLTEASDRDRNHIYRIRHEIYARELGQHSLHREGLLTDSLDLANHYLVARYAEEILGFICITPPTAGHYSIDKYFSRKEIPFEFGDHLYEIRLLTVVDGQRNTHLFQYLCHAAFRWVESRGGTHLCGMGRGPLMSLYRRLGMTALPLFTKASALDYQLMHGAIPEIRNQTKPFLDRLARNQHRIDWQLPFPFQSHAPCFHGGSFFPAIGTRFNSLEKRHDIINADVLDAWFPPAPGVIEALKEDLPWLLRTSPPTDCEGLVHAIAETRNVRPLNILPGAGSSDLIFRAFCNWLTPRSNVLILDPSYGEYLHVLENVIGCRISRFKLNQDDDFDVNLDDLREEASKDYDLVVLVNPNSPTGRHIPAESLKEILRTVPRSTKIWIDETYLDYVGPSESLEPFAAESDHVFVCKSMSKVYALSGARSAYLCALPHHLDTLRSLTPPWVIGLPSQLAAVRALEDPGYYAARYQETHHLREQLARELQYLGWEPIKGVANFILCHLPQQGPKASEIIRKCRDKNLFLRDPGSMGSLPDQRMIRIAVKDSQTNARMLEILNTQTGGPKQHRHRPASEAGWSATVDTR